MAEAVVVSGHQMHGVHIPHQLLLHKGVPGQGHHLPVKGRQDDPLYAVQALHQPPPVLRRVDEQHRLSRDHLLRRAVKGKYHRLCAQLPGPLHGLFQQGPVAPMHPVKKAQGNDCLVQNLSRSEKVFQGSHGVPL